MAVKMKDLTAKNEAALKQVLAETGRELRDLRRRVAQQDLKNVRAIRAARVTVARVYTILRHINNKTDSKPD